MRYLRVGFLSLLAIVLITIAIANRDQVTLTLFPQELGQLIRFNASIDTPLFVVIFCGIIAGVLIGFLWEWLREYKFRAEGSRSALEVNKLQREVRKLEVDKYDEKDEVLALLDRAN
tara:strand:+ start:51 stop:401 length:351 start_codon:yes stop_codon:yes gene_type:complete